MSFLPVDEQLAIIRRGIEKIVPETELADRLKESFAVWHTNGDYVPSGRLTSGKVGQCARDKVGECRRCGTIVCRVRSFTLRVHHDRYEGRYG